MEQRLRDEAKTLLEQERVDYIIGFEPGSLKFTTTPLITNNKDDVDRLATTAELRSQAVCFFVESESVHAVEASPKYPVS